jgi:RNA polymerase sigma-70 factor (ECF subfamily)
MGIVNGEVGTGHMEFTAAMPADDAARGRASSEQTGLLEELMLAHQKRVFALALRMLGDAEEAANATQDCFLRAFRSMARCPAADAERRHWLLRIVANLCLDRLRSRRWRAWMSRVGLGIREAGTASSAIGRPERDLLARELGDRLSLALRRLSPRQRAVFVLRHYEGLSLEEIASQLALRVGTVKAHLARAIGNLREELKDLYGKQSPER